MKGVHMGACIRSAVSERVCPLSYIAAGDAGVALVLHTTVIQRLRHGAVSFRANPFLRNKSRLKSFRALSKTGLKPPVLASRSIVSDCDYYLLANNVLWHGSDR